MQDQCKICFDDYPVKEMRSAACNHRFCKACWKGYVNAKIAEGPAVLNLRCPLPNCRAAVRPHSFRASQLAHMMCGRILRLE